MRLEIEPEPELNGPRGIALREHLPEVRRAPVRRGIAVDRAVEQVADLGLEPQLALVGEREHLEDVDVLAEVREPAHVAVALWSVPELKRPRIRPAGRIVVAIRERIEVAEVRHACLAGPVWTLLVSEQQPAKVVCHGNGHRAAAFVAQDAADVPTTEHVLDRASIGAWDRPREPGEQHVRRIVVAQNPWQRIGRILHAAVASVTSLPTLRSI